MFGSLDISTSGLVAQRTRLEVVSANIANTNTIEDAEGNYAPFRRRFATIAAGDPSRGSRLGVHVNSIEQDRSPFVRRHEPGHKFADAEGYVNYPNVNTQLEQINAMEASRAYEANVIAAEATKAMLRSALELLA